MLKPEAKKRAIEELKLVEELDFSHNLLLHVAEKILKFLEKLTIIKKSMSKNY